ncbi:MFS transporter [Penicillium malachiteum]|uniref:MFS transporter n=1 Tax=Penicillium malachiteum TaxID=1324776 RepID=A0AAD6HG29_9EURO|nr:MFS transporter [Penicillium malachiteum]
MSRKFGINSYSFWIVTYVAVGTISSAYGLAIIGTTVGQPDFYRFFNLASEGEPGYVHTTNIIGALNGVNSAGAIAGSIFQAWSGDYFGRKWTMQFGLIVLMIGGTLCAGTVNMTMFIIGRLVAGIGSGTLACIVPAYQAEMATAETRGAMVAVTGVMYAVGYSLAAWLGYACYHIKSTASIATFSWRFPLAVQVLFPLIVLVGSAFVPESPRWLLQQGHREKALSVVTRLQRDVVKARQEFFMIEKQFELDKSISTKWYELFRTPANRRRALVAFALMWGDQFLGIFVITNYGVLIYESIGFEGSIPLLLYACWASFTLIGNTWTAVYVDRYGRRIFLLVGSIGCVSCLIFLCALCARYLGTDNISGLHTAVFFVFFYCFWWCFFMDATQYIYIAEIFPNHLRTQGVALGITAFYLASEVTLVAAPVALTNIGWKFYLVLIVPSLFYIGVIYFFFPETKGRTLEEIGALFGDDAHVAFHWYDATAEEREKMAEEALRGLPIDESSDDKAQSFHLDFME